MKENITLIGALRRRIVAWGAVVIGVASFVIYFITCYRTITWWDSVNYTTAAVCLGIPAPPGSLIAVIVGWIVSSFVRVGSEAFALNLVAALLAAITSTLAALAALSIDSPERPTQPSIGIDLRSRLVAAAIVGGLTCAFGTTLWLHATKFTPYIFTACLTSILLWQLLRWWQEADRASSGRRLVIVMFLLGLDFSIHRTNLLLSPGVLVWILLRRPQILGRAKSWLLGAASLIAGLLIHLLLIPMAARHPYMNFNDPSTLSRFWEYVSLRQFGGGWLLELFPRESPFWSNQVADYVRVFRLNFFDLSGWGGIVGALPSILALTGIISLWRTSWKMCLGLLVLFLLASFGAVLYFNIPSGFFRSFDRHYLPSFVIFSVWLVYGGIAVTKWFSRIVPHRPWAGVALFGLGLVVLPGIELVRYYGNHDSSRNFFAYDYARNLLATLPPNSIIFTYGDSDTFPLWYLQSVEKERPDVTVMNVGLLNTGWYVEQLLAQHPDLPLRLAVGEIDRLAPRKWTDTTIVVDVDGVQGNAASGTSVVHSVEFHVPAALQNQYLLAQDWLLVRIISLNRFRRPIYFSSVGGSGISPWLTGHLRLEGLAFRLVPGTSPAPDLSILHKNLFDRYSYRGYADSTVFIDDASMPMTLAYWQVFHQYLEEVKSRKGESEFRAEKAGLVALVPLSRCSGLPPQLVQWIESEE